MLSLYFQHGQKNIVSLNVTLAPLSLGVCVVVVGTTPFHLCFAKLSSIWKPVLKGSNENCSPAFIPVLGCFSDISAVLVQVLSLSKCRGTQWLGNLLGWRWVSLTAGKKVPFFWLGLPYSPIIKRTCPKMKWGKPKKSWRRTGFLLLDFFLYVNFISKRMLFSHMFWNKWHKIFHEYANLIYKMCNCVFSKIIQLLLWNFL